MDIEMKGTLTAISLATIVLAAGPTMQKGTQYINRFFEPDHVIEGYAKFLMKNHKMYDRYSRLKGSVTVCMNNLESKHPIENKVKWCAYKATVPMDLNPVQKYAFVKSILSEYKK